MELIRLRATTRAKSVAGSSTDLGPPVQHVRSTLRNRHGRATFAPQCVAPLGGPGDQQRAAMNLSRRAARLVRQVYDEHGPDDDMKSL